MNVQVFTDGAARGAPGPASCGAIVLDASGELLARVGLALGDATVNEAEWQGVIIGLKKARDLGATEVDLRSDSQVIIRQFTGEYACNAQNLLPLRDEARAIATAFTAVIASHIPREQNKDADKITREVLDGKFDSESSAATTEIAVTLTVRVVLDPKVALTRLAGGATVLELRRELSERVSRGIPRAINVGDSIQISRSHR
jgi:ribonuclease HI